MPGILRPLALLLLALGPGLTAGEPPAQPMLQLETGMHTAMIKQIAVDGNGRMLARLTADYEHWADSVGVVDWNIQQPKLLDAWKMKDEHG